MEKDQDEKQNIDQVTVPERNVEETHDSEKHTENVAATSDAGEPQHEYITGIKLWSVLVAVTLVILLMMLDMSIIVTVRF
jgi:hypothetical protein